MESTKLWGGRFEQGLDAFLFSFNASLATDIRLLEADLRASSGYARALEKAGVGKIARLPFSIRVLLEAALRQAISEAPAAAPFQFNLGNLLSEQDRPEESVTAYKAALALEPGHAEAASNLGTTLRNMGDLEGAKVEITAQLRARAELPPRPDCVTA